jgi:hypothetical protein
MKKLVITLIAITGMLVLVSSCKNMNKKESTKSASTGSEKITSTEVSSDLIVIGKDIVTEVIVKPDTLGDPWEVEKVKNYTGTRMLTNLFENIYSKKLTVYDIMTGKPLDPEAVRKIEKEFGSDLSRIGKLQFLEDWYFNPSTNKIIKKIKSVSFAYELKRGSGLPVGYKALFSLNMEK